MNKYADIIDLEYHKSTKRPWMTIEERAGQFAPFAALTGYSDEVKEASRLTSNKSILSEDDKMLLDQKVQYILNNPHKNYSIKITYFIPDDKKSGGSYETIICRIKKIDKDYFLTTEKKQIAVNDIIAIEILDSN